MHRKTIVCGVVAWTLLSASVAAGSQETVQISAPIEAVTAVTGSDLVTFEAMATSTTDHLAPVDDAQLSSLLKSSSWSSALTASASGLPWWGGLFLGLALGLLAGLGWWAWTSRSRSWRAELEALGEGVADSLARRRGGAAAGWRLSRIDELPQFWQDTVVMARDDAYDLEEGSAALGQKRLTRGGRGRVPRNRWATTVIPRSI